MDIKNEKAFNRALGLRLMALRQRRAISQHDLGAMIGVSGQQIQKYENGINRITPEKLAQCAQILKASIGYFYGEFDGVPALNPQNTNIQTLKQISALHPDVQHTLKEHIRAVYRLSRNANHRAG